MEAGDEAWTVEKTFRFEAAHVLPKHGGKCARVHGHSYAMKIVCRGISDDLFDPTHEDGPEAGMLLDHARITEVVQPIVEAHLDHWFLNESTGLENPTVELLCRWLWDKIRPGLPALYLIHIRETCTAAYTYRRA